ncbi:MAG: hypothetical protein JWO44_2426 [Bacteroidetes bacterium]|nr:hypothetical protein [Bacteroidota bacterium]
MLAMLFVHFVHAQQNSTYALNDPRNPDCPCHKLQKQAEEEYAQQHTSGLPEKHEQESQSVNTGKNSETNSTAVKTGSGNPSSVKKKKKKFSRWNDLKFRCAKKMSITKKMRPDYSVCYRW